MISSGFWSVKQKENVSPILLMSFWEKIEMMKKEILGQDIHLNFSIRYELTTQLVIQLSYSSTLPVKAKNLNYIGMLWGEWVLAFWAGVLFTEMIIGGLLCSRRLIHYSKNNIIKPVGMLVIMGFFPSSLFFHSAHEAFTIILTPIPTTHLSMLLTQLL